MRKIVVPLLAMSFFAPSVSAQGLKASAERTAARLAAESAQEASQPMIMGMSRTHFGLGLGLLAGGGGVLAYLAVTQGEKCTYESGPGWSQTTCLITSYPTSYWVAAAGGMGAGAAVWLIGASSAKKVVALTPAFVPVRGGWIVRKSLRF